MLSKDEQRRYKRQLSITGWGEAGQARLGEAVVTVVGAGGLGSPALFALAGAGVGNLRIIDYDIVEMSNLNRQTLHTTEAAQLGISKAASAAKTIAAYNPEIKLVPVEERLTSANAASLLGGSSILIDCLDNFETRAIVNRFAVESRTPLVHAGISEFGFQATFIHAPETPCLACFLPQNNTPAPPNVIGATAGIAGNILANEAIKFLTGIGVTLKGKLLFWDGKDSSFAVMSIKHKPSCPVCGGLHS